MLSFHFSHSFFFFFFCCSSFKEKAKTENTISFPKSFISMHQHNHSHLSFIIYPFSSLLSPFLILLSPLSFLLSPFSFSHSPLTSPSVCWGGLVLCVCGEALRGAAMATAGTNFNHQIEEQARRDHVLVTHGVYKVLIHVIHQEFILCVYLFIGSIGLNTKSIIILCKWEGK